MAVAAGLPGGRHRFSTIFCQRFEPTGELSNNAQGWPVGTNHCKFLSSHPRVPDDGRDRALDDWLSSRLAGCLSLESLPLSVLWTLFAWSGRCYDWLLSFVTPLGLASITTCAGWLLGWV